MEGIIVDKDIIELWEKNKHKLREYFATHEQSLYSDYESLVKLIVKFILNDESSLEEYDADNITVITNGDYQGILIFIIPKDMYYPTEEDFLVTYVYYGSCEACDVLKGIRYAYYDDAYYDDDSIPNQKQIEDYMTLCLHIIQHMKKLY
jgi:hypothetical protein